ncbi:MAG: hypothetical protein IJ041_03080 [Clostridia bacterium]|nr:hypothetical protein [Clostridia bacterium]
MSKRTLTMIVAMVAALLIATTGTLAYLTDTDGAVNVMTIGNVDIEQIEEQRPEIGSTELEEFEQFKPLLPAVHDTNGDNKIAWAPESEWPVPEDYTGDHPEAYKVFNNNITNVQDKFVNVENTGKNDAYVRTIIAYEWPEELDDLIHISINDIPGVVAAEEVGFVELDGVRYMVYGFVYDEALAPGEETIPSLKQIFLNKATTSEDVALFGENFEVLALSQAVQADGFDNAQEALDEAFYPLSADEEQLIEDLETLLAEEYPVEGEVKLPTTSWKDNADTSWYNTTDTTFTLSTAEELAGLAEIVNGGNGLNDKTIKLGADIDLGDNLWTPVGQTGSSYGATSYFQGNFDGQGHTISNLFITETNDGEHYAAGMFGFLDAGSKNNTIGNFTIDGAVVNGHHWTGAAVGYLTGTLENVTVKNAKITCTHANGDACGDKAGVVCGTVNGDEGTMKNCVAENSTVTAGRDAGQVVGAARPSQVTGCSATDVTVTATGDCPEEKNINEAVIGRQL